MINTERMFEKREEAEPHADTGKPFNRRKVKYFIGCGKV